MIAILILACLLILFWVFYVASRDQPSPQSPRGQTSPRPPPPRRPPLPRGNRRFHGRQVEAVPTVFRARSQASRNRLRNGEKVPAVRNGEIVMPEDAIGLGCLAPISECTLGDRCICLNRHERQSGGL